MLHEKNAPISGTASEVGGVICATILRNTHTDKRMVISENIFIINKNALLINKKPKHVVH